MPNLLKCIGNHGIVCSACWSHAWIYRTWEDCYAQVNRYPGNLHKKYNTEAEGLRAYYSHPAYLANHGQLTYYGPMNANHGHPLALEIEEKPPARDVKIRRIAPWSWKDVMLLFMAMVSAFLIWS